jgi:beta-glucanase (GH16 family)
MVPLDRVIDYVRRVKQGVEQAVTVADNYEWWAEDGAPLAAEVDFIGVHTYPMWEHKTIDEALDSTIENIDDVQAALPGKQIAILEAGWATTASEFPEQANEANQARYYREIKQWAAARDITVFFFEAFDEPWKGNPANALGAEKHWGLFRVDRTPKEVMMDSVATWYDRDAVAWAVNLGGAEHIDPGAVHYQADPGDLGGSAGAVEGIRGVQDAKVYETYRTGALAIRRPLPNGSYDLTFQFMEPEDIPVGERVFDVLVQGETVIDGLDVRQVRDGNHRAGLDRSVTGVKVSDGVLAVDFIARSGEPVLSGLVVRSRTPDLRGWELAWADEFDYEGAPDPEVWNIEIWPPRKVNNEDQAYTDRAKNLRVSGGRLVIEAHKESFADAEYTSGRIHSRGKRDFLYGRADIRARLPAGQGTWAALWMMPSDFFRYATSCNEREGWEGDSDCDAWPNSGEIDIMEHVGYDMGVVHGTVHNRAYYWKNQEQRKGSIVNVGVDEDFHIYSIEWTPDAIYVYCDGSPYFAYYRQEAGWEAWPYDHPYHLIFNLAIGGDWGRAGGPIDDSIFPVSMEVDYVRVYQPAEQAAAVDP